MATPHNNANKGDIAKTILLPGDPLRAKYIAENYLEDAKQFTDVRGMYGYTGIYKGKEISVMGTGMGCASMGIYSYELIHMYGVENLIRIGSCGGFREDLELGQMVIAMGAFFLIVIDDAVGGNYQRYMVSLLVLVLIQFYY